LSEKFRHPHWIREHMPGAQGQCMQKFCLLGRYPSITYSSFNCEPGDTSISGRGVLNRLHR